LSGFRIHNHGDVLCAGTTIKMFGVRLDVFTYLADGLLVDTGPSRYARQFTGFFQNQPIRQVALTHCHEDHSGNAPWLVGQGIPVFVHQAALAICQERTKLPLYRRCFWGERSGFRAQPFDNILETDRKKWQVIELPGHSPDHVALYDASNGAFFTGDLVVTPKTRVIFKWENIPQTIRSLRHLMAYDFQTVYCAHAGVLADGRKVVERKIAFLEELTGRVLSMYQKGWDIRAIDRAIFSPQPFLAFITGKEMASEHIIKSIIHHR